MRSVADLLNLPVPTKAPLSKATNEDAVVDFEDTNNRRPEAVEAAARLVYY